MHEAQPIPLAFSRQLIRDLPAKLLALANADAPNREALKKAAGVFDGAMQADRKADPIIISRPERSWRWLIGAARQAGAFSFATVCEYRLSVWREDAAERADLERRKAEAKEIADRMRAEEAASA